MAKSQSKDNGGAAAATVVTEGAVINRTLTYRRDHPQNRCSYGVEGNSGIVVFDLGLFDPSEIVNGARPETIEVSVKLVAPKADAKAAREAAQAAKIIERAEKAQAKLAAQQAKAAERQAKADAALAAAKAKVEAANAAKAAAEGQAATGTEG